MNQVARQPYNLSDGRVERDDLGTRHVPCDVLYGVQTLRALENFKLGGERLQDRPALIVALAQVKVAAALANREVGVLEPRLADAIVEAAREVAAGRLHDHFPLELVQGGGGTSTHMNMNEVLANRANELIGCERGQYSPIHPNDHVNRSQSTNDILPTATGIAVYVTSRKAQAQLRRLSDQLLRHAETAGDLEHLGRTCLRDALPVPVSAVHRAQAHQVERSMEGLETAAGTLLAVPVGATAVGTGLGAPDGFRELAIHYLRTETSLDIRLADDSFAALASLEQFAAVADAMARAGRALARIAADLRLLASGPIGGIGEVRLPPIQPGSSMMPGKINPVLPELVMQVSYQLAGAAHAVRLAAGAGELEVNTMGPVVTVELLRGLERLGRVATLFSDLCVAGMRWDRERVQSNLLGSMGTALDSVQHRAHRDDANTRADDVNGLLAGTRHEVSGQ